MKVGKRIGGYVYVHRDAADLLGEREVRALADARAVVPQAQWNVAKIGEESVSLLLYESFDASAFPALLRSTKIVGPAPAVTDYSSRDSPPILHRKELLLRPNDPRIPRFAALTASAEKHGLFKDAKTIGTRRRWMTIMTMAGLELRGHDLVRPTSEPDVARHKTAITRRDLSQPMSLAMRLGIVHPGATVLDYGCGQGDDVAALVGAGFDAVGWDPHHAPDGPLRPSSVVNCGFVLNVIEDPVERMQVLKSAWQHAERALLVSVMTIGKGEVTRLRPYGDGFLTARGTFQRYFRQDELRDLVARGTGQQPLYLAPGIVAAFRDSNLEQEVSYRRRSRAAALASGFTVPPRPQRPPAATRNGDERLRVRIGVHLEALWRTALEIGRIPRPVEMSPDIAEALECARISAERAIRMCIDMGFGDTGLAEAATARRDDLLVHFALTLFPGAPRYASLPASMQRDVKAFFGSHARMMDEATRLLHSAGRKDALETAIVTAVSAGLGGVKAGRFSFTLPTVPRLPTVLRAFVGCAEVLHEDLSSFDYAEMDSEAALLTAYRCDRPDSAFPKIIESSCTDLRALKTKRRQGGDRILYLRHLHMPSDAPGREAQRGYDAKLLAAGIIAEDGSGPGASGLASLLAGAGRDGPVAEPCQKHGVSNANI